MGFYVFDDILNDGIVNIWDFDCGGCLVEWKVE